MRALDNAGIDPKTGVEVLNQQPQVGASALESGQAQALSQFVAWPGLLVFQDKAKLLYDGAEGNYPTFHGVVVRRDYASQHPEVLDAFLQAQLDATEFLNQNPLESAKLVADGSGLPQEVVYLYNGPGGTSFDTTLKPSLIQAFKGDVPYLKSIGDFADLDIDKFVDDTAIRKAFTERGQDYDAALNATTNPSALRGQDPVCNVAVTDPKLASELWLDRQGRPPSPPPTPAACCVPSARPPHAVTRCARPTFPTPSSAPGGSPTSPSGSRTAPTTCRSARSRAPSATPVPTPARPSSTTSRRWRVRCDRPARGAGRRRSRGRRRDADHRQARRAPPVLALVAGARRFGGRGRRALAVVDRQPRSVLVAVRHPADGHRDRHGVRPPARHRRTTGWTSGSR